MPVFSPPPEAPAVLPPQGGDTYSLAKPVLWCLLEKRKGLLGFFFSHPLMKLLREPGHFARTHVMHR